MREDIKNSDAYKAHEFSSHHREQLQHDKVCGCFYCLSIFSPEEIRVWLKEKDGRETAMCPYCFVDSVIGESSGYPITKEFLLKMRRIWFF